MRPLVWIGSQCRVIFDAPEGTVAGQELECDYCGTDCVCTACYATEFEDTEEEEVPTIDPQVLEYEVLWEHAARERARRGEP